MVGLEGLEHYTRVSRITKAKDKTCPPPSHVYMSLFVPNYKTALSTNRWKYFENVALQDLTLYFFCISLGFLRCILK
jgi:hypothetical protein